MPREALRDLERGTLAAQARDRGGPKGVAAGVRREIGRAHPAANPACSLGLAQIPTDSERDLD
jgi:hypothetical protein